MSQHDLLLDDIHPEESAPAPVQSHPVEPATTSRMQLRSSGTAPVVADLPQVRRATRASRAQNNANEQNADLEQMGEAALCQFTPRPMAGAAAARAANPSPSAQNDFTGEAIEDTVNQALELFPTIARYKLRTCENAADLFPDVQSVDSHNGGPVANLFRAALETAVRETRATLQEKYIDVSHPEILDQLPDGVRPFLYPDYAIRLQQVLKVHRQNARTLDLILTTMIENQSQAFTTACNSPAVLPKQTRAAPSPASVALIDHPIRPSVAQRAGFSVPQPVLFDTAVSAHYGHRNRAAASLYAESCLPQPATQSSQQRHVNRFVDETVRYAGCGSPVPSSASGMWDVEAPGDPPSPGSSGSSSPSRRSRREQQRRAGRKHCDHDSSLEIEVGRMTTASSDASYRTAVTQQTAARTDRRRAEAQKQAELVIRTRRRHRDDEKQIEPVLLANSLKYDADFVASSLPPFSGDEDEDVAKWWVVFEKETKQLLDETRILIARRVLRGRAQRWFIDAMCRDDVKGKKPTSADWGRRLKAEFHITPHARRSQAQNYIQRPDQSAADYVAMKLSLIEAADIARTHEDKVSILMEGVHKMYKDSVRDRVTYIFNKGTRDKVKEFRSVLTAVMVKFRDDTGGRRPEPTFLTVGPADKPAPLESVTNSELKAVLSRLQALESSYPPRPVAAANGVVPGSVNDPRRSFFNRTAGRYVEDDECIICLSKQHKAMNCPNSRRRQPQYRSRDTSQYRGPLTPEQARAAQDKLIREAQAATAAASGRQSLPGTERSEN